MFAVELKAGIVTDTHIGNYQELNAEIYMEFSIGFYIDIYIEP